MRHLMQSTRRRLNQQRAAVDDGKIEQTSCRNKEEDYVKAFAT
jgi:hypothetical protein